MKKQKPMVTIPVKHTCVPLHDYITLVLSLRDSENKVSALRSALGKSDLTVESLKKKNDELNERIRGLNEELSKAHDGGNYWYDSWSKLHKEHEDLHIKYRKLLDSMISEAEGTEAAPNAKTEAD